MPSLRRAMVAGVELGMGLSTGSGRLSKRMIAANRGCDQSPREPASTSLPKVLPTLNSPSPGAGWRAVEFSGDIKGLEPIQKA